jgi:hypothetical protein
MSPPFTLLETSRLLGHYRHAELVGYATLGPRALSTLDGEVRLFLVRATSSHAYRAGLLEGLLPVSVTLPDAASLTVPADDRIDGAFALLSSAPDADLVAGLVQVVYPLIDASYAAHAERCSSFADPPFALVLARLRAELALVIEAGRHVATEGETELLADLEDLLISGARFVDRH